MYTFAKRIIMVRIHSETFLCHFIYILFFFEHINFHFNVNFCGFSSLLYFFDNITIVLIKFDPGFE